VAIFLHTGAPDRLHQAFSIAATACAAGRPVDLYFFWFALEALAQGALGLPHFEGRDDLTERFETDRYPTAQALLDVARSTGRCTTYACSASASLFGLGPERVAALVDHHVGMATILEASRGVVDRFYF